MPHRKFNTPYLINGSEIDQGQDRPSVIQHTSSSGGENTGERLSAQPNQQSSAPVLPHPEPEPEIIFTPIIRKRVKRLKADGWEYKVSIKMVERLPLNILDFFSKVFEKIASRVLDGIPDHDAVGIVCAWDALEHPAYWPLGLKKDFSVPDFISKLDGIIQSGKNISLHDPITISVTRVEMPRGEGRCDTRGIRSRNEPNLRKWLAKKQCVILIENEDDLCLGRALAVAIARAEWKAGKITAGRYAYLRMSKKVGQKIKAIELYKAAHVPLGACGLPEVLEFQKHLTEYQINIRSVDTAGGLIHKGADAPNQIDLLYGSNHFDVITSLPAIFGRSYYCRDCESAYNSKHRHRCRNACKCCRKENCPLKKWLKCEDCNRWFKSKNCFDNHKQLGRPFNIVTVQNGWKKIKRYPPMSVCEKFKTCRECTLPVVFSKTHVCGLRDCRLCKKLRPPDHLCYIPKVEEDSHLTDNLDVRRTLKVVKKKKSEHGDCESRCPEPIGSDDDHSEPDSDYDEVLVNVPRLDDVYQFIWYDMETTQNEPIPQKEDWFVHRPNLIVAQTSCNGCSKMLIQREECEKCEKVVFRGSTSLKEFVDWVLTRDGAILVAHNGSGFDGVILMREVTSRGLLIKNVILKGQKIMSCKIPCGDHGIRMVDSMNFIMSPLSFFPKLFNLTELKKGYFPHLFNTHENAEYKGAMPDMTYYDPDSMKTDSRELFLDWYKMHKNDHFDMKKELLEYCTSDVDILCQGMMRFRKMFYDLTKIDCLRKCTTIASAAMRTFQKNFLVEDQLGVIPRHGYTNHSRQSRIGFVWLKWWSHCNGGVCIQHNGNGKEFRVGKYLVDGYHRESNTLLEFLGCHWHSCPKCNDLTKMNPSTKRLRKDEYDSSMMRIAELEQCGYNMVTVWECDFKQQMEENDDLKTFLRDLGVSSPLSPGDSLFGGRTNALRLHYECAEDEEIKVLDFTSLYPYCNSRCPYPIGHPTIVTENFSPLSTYFGFVKCRVLPPKSLFLPVLPLRTKGKLVFPLCHSCAEHQTTHCTHEEDERAWTGTFVSNELQKAVAVGYSVLQIYEVWHWTRVAKYSTETMSGGLFTEYIKMFLKIKQESSGWPLHCESNDDRLLYLKRYFEHEGIRLDPSKIQKSPIRAVGKLLLNSLWGKFAQNPDLAKTEYVSSYENLARLLLDENVEVRTLNLLNDNLAVIQYKDRIPSPLCTENIVIAAFTTAHARLRLYNVMSEIITEESNRLLYFDTDSVFYVHRPHLPDPVCGKFLGDLTDEYPERKIVRFVSGGPKNYAFEFEDGGSVVKVKGFTLNHRNSTVITPPVMLAMAKQIDGSQIEILNPKKISRSATHGVISKPERKRYRVVYTKRILNNDGTTLPFGYSSANMKRSSDTSVSVIKRLCKLD